jgi:hypothetical protein
MAEIEALENARDGADRLWHVEADADEHLLPKALRSRNERPRETIAAVESSRAASRMKFRFEYRKLSRVVQNVQVQAVQTPTSFLRALRGG